MSTEKTSEECVKAAFAALLRGDTKERDRLCDRAKALVEAEQYADAVTKVLSVNFYVTKKGVAIPTKHMAKVAGAISS